MSGSARTGCCCDEEPSVCPADCAGCPLTLVITVESVSLRVVRNDGRIIAECTVGPFASEVVQGETQFCEWVDPEPSVFCADPCCAAGPPPVGNAMPLDFQFTGAPGGPSFAFALSCEPVPLPPLIGAHVGVFLTFAGLFGQFERPVATANYAAPWGGGSCPPLGVPIPFFGAVASFGGMFIDASSPAVVTL